MNGSTYDVSGAVAGADDDLVVAAFATHEELGALHGFEERNLPVHVLGVAVLLLVEGHQVDV